MDGPAEFSKLFFYIGERVFERAATVLVGGALGENALALHLKRLKLTRSLGFSPSLPGLIRLCCARIGCCLGKLLFHGFTLPSSGHKHIVRRRAEMTVPTDKLSRAS
jgi:hypothetical protein